MAYQKLTTVADTEGLLSAISTFAATLGWTVDIDTPATKWAMHKGNNYISGYVTNNTTGTAVFYHNTGYDGGFVASDQPGRCGDSDTNARQTLSQLDAGPFPNVWFFGSSTAGEDYIHVIVEQETGVFNHAFGCGILQHFGDWTGGEYLWATNWARGNANIDNIQSQVHELPFDCGGNGQGAGTTMRFTGSEWNPQMGIVAGSKWCRPTGNNNRAYRDTDNITIETASGTNRSVFHSSHTGTGQSDLTGSTPLIPIQCFLRNVSPAPDALAYMGWVPDARMITLYGIAAAEEITIGGDTWVCFPVCRKYGATDTFNSNNAGWAYKKIT